MNFEMQKYDSETQKRRAEGARRYNPRQLYIQKMTPEILRLLRETDLKTAEVGKKVGVGESSVANVARRNGINLMERNAKLREKAKPKAKAKLGSVLHETLTGDGVSLKWLSMNW